MSVYTEAGLGMSIHNRSRVPPARDPGTQIKTCRTISKTLGNISHQTPLLPFMESQSLTTTRKEKKKTLNGRADGGVSESTGSPVKHTEVFCVPSYN